MKFENNKLIVSEDLKPVTLLASDGVNIINTEGRVRSLAKKWSEESEREVKFTHEMRTFKYLQSGEPIFVHICYIDDIEMTCGTWQAILVWWTAFLKGFEYGKDHISSQF
jgi:hypothetical protein